MIRKADYIRRELASNPAIPCKFKAGEKVLYTNVYGVKFEMRVIGFSSGKMLDKYGMHIHLEHLEQDGQDGAYWFPHKESDLRPLIV